MKACYEGPFSREAGVESNEPLITAEEVAPILRVKVGTVYDAAWRGLIPCVRLWTGKRKSLLRFRRSEIEQFIRDRSVPARERK